MECVTVVGTECAVQHFFCSEGYYIILLLLLSVDFLPCTSCFQGRTNLPPEKVPWDAVVTLLSQCIYGGKIDNDFDQRLLASFLAKLFTPRSFEADFALVANVDGVAGGPGGQRHITMPDGTRRDHFLHWIESLADRQTPSWLGLPNNAEKVLLTTRGIHIVYIDVRHCDNVMCTLRAFLTQPQTLPLYFWLFVLFVTTASPYFP
jgi:hypothetical protein